MKTSINLLVAAFSFFLNSSLHAATGFFGNVYIVGGLPTVTTYYQGPGNTGDTTNPTLASGWGTLLQNQVFTIRGFEVRTYNDNGSSVNSMRMIWTVDNFATTNLIELLSPTSTSGNDKTWQITSSIQDLITNAGRGTLAVGNYTFQSYFEGSTNGTDSATSIFLNNGGSNYQAAFTVAVPEPSSASLMALGTAGLLALRRRRNA